MDQWSCIMKPPVLTEQARYPGLGHIQADNELVPPLTYSTNYVSVAAALVVVEMPRMGGIRECLSTSMQTHGQ